MPQGFEPVPDTVLRDLAGAGAFSRGKTYHAEGRVRLSSVTPNRVIATVVGSEVYRVELQRIGAGLGGQCDCPAFDSTDVCKHMVAVALAAGESGASERVSQTRARLVARGAEALADLVIAAALRDPGLAEALETELADEEDDDPALIARYRRAIDKATDPTQRVDYWGAGAVAGEIETLRARLDRLAQSGRVQPAHALADRLIEGLIDVIERADDSEGELHAVGGRVIALHADLCAKTSVDPLALAETLFEREVSAVTDLFSGALQDYRGALGVLGRTEFLRLAQHAWTALPSRKRGGDDHRRAPLKWILDAAFAEDGDLEARVALRQGDLTTPDAYREIAGLYDAADRLDEAVRWIEDGLWAFEGLANDQLEGLGAELMMKVGRTDEAEHLYWALFERRPSLRQFLLVAQVCPTTAAPRALEFLKTAAKGEPRRDRFSVGPEAALMEIQIHLGDFSSAWETAETWPVGDYAIRRLADQSAATHPQPATAAYSRLAEARISAATASGYDEAITLIRSRGETCGDLADQAAFIEGLRQRHKAKRTFIQRLNALGGA